MRRLPVCCATLMANSTAPRVDAVVPHLVQTASALTEQGHRAGPASPTYVNSS